jgi:hypothetical protein
MKCDALTRLPGIFVVIAAVGGGPCPAGAETVDFEDLTPATAYAGPGGGSYWNGSDDPSAGKFTSGSLEFNNHYDTTWQSWDGWSYSTTTDTGTAGYTNQYSAYAGGGGGGSATYGVGFHGFTGAPEITLRAGYYVSSAMITNTTYAALAMLNGDAFSKKFGGDTGTDPDWFLLTITGVRDGDAVVGTKEVYLADYRDANNANDYYLEDWISVDLSGLIGARKLEFSLTSSDVDPLWGMNTPGYFAMDNLVVEEVPEPSTLVTLFSAAAALLLLRRRRR